MKYKYSIIVPHYNDFESLIKLVNRIPQREDIEIIIVDDYSSDEFDFSYFNNIKGLTFVSNIGAKSAGACRNIGLCLATGKWLLFADSDDFFLPNAFDILSESANDDFDIIYFSPTSIDLETGLNSIRHIQYKELVKGFLLNKNNTINYYFYVPWSKLILNSFIQKYSIKFDEVLASNDVMFSLQAGLNAKRIEAIDKEIYCVTKREGSLTSRLSHEVLRSRYEVSLRRNNLLHQSNLKAHQESVYSLIKRYHKIFNVRDCWYLFKLLLLGKVLLFPVIFKTYFKSPRALYSRLFRKG